MNSIINQIYNGEIAPVYDSMEQCEELRKIRRKHYSQYENFLSRLEPQMAIEFEQIMDAQIETLPIEFAESFSEGFKLGALLMIEVFNSKFFHGN